MRGILNPVAGTEKSACIYFTTMNVGSNSGLCFDCVPFLYFCCPCLIYFPFVFSCGLLHLTGLLVYSFSPSKSIIHTVTHFFLLKLRASHATLSCFNAPVTPHPLQENVRSLAWHPDSPLYAYNCFPRHTLRLQSQPTPDYS